MNETPKWNDGFIAVDWGTTNRRAYRLGPDRECAQSFADDRGVMSVPRGGFAAAVAEITDRLGDFPLLLAGMAGSTRGWMDAPYLPCPLGLQRLSSQLVWAVPRKAAIVPGAGFIGEDRADIMRGEEVQILGAAADGLIPGTCLVCHPGTHNKWVEVEDGAIRTFRTVITGEIFNLLRSGSILAEQLHDPVEPCPAFRDGVRRGMETDLVTAEIFSVRARALLGTLAPEDTAAFASGIMIGADVAAGLKRNPEGDIYVMGGPGLTALYAAAIAEAGRQSVEVDGEKAFIAGASRIVERMQ